MTSDPGMSRRVARLENDTESIYELITEVRSTQDEHTRRFDRLVDRVESTFTEVRSTQDEHTRRFDRLESTLGEVVRRLPEPS
jgi:septation ring formation regulator EzrA